MFSKEELLEKDIPELENIAKDLEVDYKKSDDKEAIIYAILDRQAVNAGISHPMGTTKRKRTRITKKDSDKVYTVHGKEGENFDLQKNKVQNNTLPSLFKDLPDTQTSEKQEAEIKKPVEAPKKRGRKKKEDTPTTAKTTVEETPKSSVKEESAAEETNKTVTETSTETPVETTAVETTTKPTEEVVETETPANNTDDVVIPEAEFVSENGETNESETTENLLEQLQAKVNAHNEQMEDTENMGRDGVWEGDPGDGTDFITVVDIPVEDQGIVRYVRPSNNTY